MGLKILADRHGPLEAYIGRHVCVFKLFDARVVKKELRGINSEATPSACSEKVFMLATMPRENVG